MKALAVLLCLLCGCTSLRDSAHGATALDAATTAAGLAYTNNGGSGFLSGFTADTADAVVAASYAMAQGLSMNPTAFAAGPADMSTSGWCAFTVALRPARLRTFHTS